MGEALSTIASKLTPSPTVPPDIEVAKHYLYLTDEDSFLTHLCHVLELLGTQYCFFGPCGTPCEDRIISLSLSLCCHTNPYTDIWI